MIPAAQQYHDLGISAEADGNMVILTVKDANGGPAAIIALDWPDALKFMFNLAGAYMKAQGRIDVLA